MSNNKLKVSLRQASCVLGNICLDNTLLVVMHYVPVYLVTQRFQPLSRSEWNIQKYFFLSV